jgi:uncharacterized protein YneF (UPF0154 family)
MATSIMLGAAGVSSILVIVLSIVALLIGVAVGYGLNYFIVKKKIQNSKITKKKTNKIVYVKDFV